jgi:hypothetical protein
MILFILFIYHRIVFIIIKQIWLTHKNLIFIYLL